jgi:hypothetical protein
MWISIIAQHSLLGSTGRIPVWQNKERQCPKTVLSLLKNEMR